jgi:SsrA-binding protein
MRRAAGSTCCRPPRRASNRLAGAMAKGKSKRKVGARDVASNRYASYRYNLLERLECGIVLEGTEVKALRTSGAQLKDGYAAVRDGELWLHSVHIPPYAPAARENHDPERPRKLLLHRRELERLSGRAQERGLTLVPTRIYFSGSHAKVEIALARGKDLYDKRQTLRERETKRDIERGVREAQR